MKAVSSDRRVVCTPYSHLCQIYFSTQTECFRFFFVLVNEAVLILDIISAIHSITYVSSSSMFTIAKIRLGFQVIPHTRPEKLGNMNKSQTGLQVVFDRRVSRLQHICTGLCLVFKRFSTG